MTLNKFFMTALLLGMALAVPVLFAPDAHADHMQLDGMVAKIQSDVVFAKTPWGLRMIGTTKQLDDVAVGDRVTILINEDNSVVDVYKDGTPAQHTVLNGHLIGSTPVTHELHIDTKIIVNQFIPHSGNGFPSNVRMGFFQRTGHAFNCLADDFKVAYDRVLCFPVRKEAFLPSRRIIQDLPNGVSNVEKIDAVVLHRGTASA